MGVLRTLGTIGGAIAAPFTGGASLLAGPLLGGLEGALNNRSKLSGGQKKIASSLEERLQQILADPAAGTDPLRVAGRSQINGIYAGAPDQISRQMSQRGFGGSGKQGKLLIQTDLARRGQQSELEAKIAEYILQRQMQAISAGSAYLGHPLGANKAGGALSGASDALGQAMGFSGIYGGGGVSTAGVPSPWEATQASIPAW